MTRGKVPNMFFKENFICTALECFNIRWILCIYDIPLLEYNKNMINNQCNEGYKISNFKALRIVFITHLAIIILI